MRDLMQELTAAGVSEDAVRLLVARSWDCPYLRAALRTVECSATRTPADVFAEVLLALSQDRQQAIELASDMAAHSSVPLVVPKG